RFGAVTIGSTAQVFVRVAIELENGTRATGAAAELLVPKWFDKNPQRSPDETIDDLRRALATARMLYLDGPDFDTAFGLHAARIDALIAAAAREGVPPLAAAYGAAEIDKAVLDALLRALGLDVFAGFAANV